MRTSFPPSVELSGWLRTPPAWATRLEERSNVCVKDDVIGILNSIGRQDGGDEEPSSDINNLRAAVRELQNAVVHLAEEIDRSRGEGNAA